MEAKNTPEETAKEILDDGYDDLEGLKELAQNYLELLSDSSETELRKEGMVSGPLEPTEEMIQAALDCQEYDPADPRESEIYYIYKAMIKASHE